MSVSEVTIVIMEDNSCWQGIGGLRLCLVWVIGVVWILQEFVDAGVGVTGSFGIVWMAGQEHGSLLLLGFCGWLVVALG